jgi:hypothetical protein
MLFRFVAFLRSSELVGKHRAAKKSEPWGGGGRGGVGSAGGVGGGVGGGGGSGRERCGEDGLEPGRWTQDPGPTVVCCDQISCKGASTFFLSRVRVWMCLGALRVVCALSLRANAASCCAYPQMVTGFCKWRH